MGMCAMYNFCKYGGPRPLHSTHELEYDDEDSPRSGTSSSSDGTLMLRTSATRKRRTKSIDQQSALWKRTIPKGRRCEPLDFSGLILYDEHGNRLDQSIQAQ